jgi:endonuclease/exonuclease/phosphatase family metal-dependent hydrolase
MRELGRLTGMYYYFGIAMPYDGGGYGEGLLSRLPVLSVRTIALPARAGKEPRAAIEALISLGGNKQFKLVGTHLDHTKDETDRIAQARHLQDLLEKETLPFLVAGDLNAQPTEATMGIFKSFTHWPDKDKLQFTCPSSKPDMKIDYILLSNNHPWKCSRFEVLPEKLISDHLPVKAVFSL